ncbi:23S ribosomal RNA methyltransferase Erm [Paenibacillus ginsengarvi]|uniref:rRNA adenine N-6-methyltransferase n=1 Tax=Paenibacillus ginsengarvi TaxID=400777 RepID=A0A3B0CK43_9BACL|nr:23S ribosomal RNA methyltransferase Erm [Paenibacillus ginsengarvi]RKN85068.1 23S ribosomal RNA methyltransferase Erm [Paenibacillus ginsengarvi]
MRKQNKKHRAVRKHITGPNFTAQHLLHNPGTIRKLIDMARLQPADTVLEIGAGKGSLTFSIAELTRKVIAVEIDAGFVQTLRDKAASFPHIHIIQGDIRRMRLPAEPFCVVANIPFSITTAILEKLLGAEGSMLQSGVLILEKGAAQRFTRNPNPEPKPLLWSMYFRLDMKTVIPRTHFAPPPSVDAAILRMVRRDRPLIPAGKGKHFTAFAAYLLREPRLMVANGLRGIFTPAQLKHSLQLAKADREQPVASLSLEQWASLFTSMIGHVASHRWPRG